MIFTEGKRLNKNKLEDYKLLTKVRINILLTYRFGFTINYLSKLNTIKFCR